jgi:hypothetical protein
VLLSVRSEWLVQALIDEDHLDLAAIEERTEEEDGSFEIQRARGCTGVPTFSALSEVKSEIDVSAGLVTSVWAQMPAGFGAQVANGDRRSARKMM